MSRKAAFWIAFALAMAVYAAMALWSLPRIAAEAGGLAPFDLRPAGYDLAAAREFLEALSPRGLALYLGAQHRLDLAYPALLALSFALGFAVLFRGGLRWLLVAVAIMGMGCDYLENRAVTAMLLAGPEGIDAAMVAAASRWTLLKSALTTLAGVALLAGGLVALMRRWRQAR